MGPPEGSNASVPDKATVSNDSGVGSPFLSDGETETTLASVVEAVESVEFSTAFHGYEPEQVQAFLSRFASVLRELERDLPVLGQGEAGPAVEASLEDHLPEELGEMMSAASREIRAVRDRAAQTATEEIERARQEAAAIVSGAEHQAASRTATAAQEADERTAAADERLADAEAVLRQAEVDATLARDEAEQQARKAVADAEQQAQETLAAAEKQGVELTREAQRIAENALEEAARREQEMSRRLLERQDQLQVIEDELRGMSDMATDLLNVSEFLGERVVRLRQKAKGLSGATEVSEDAIDDGVLEPTMAETAEDQ